jgi:flagellar assembly protein FliH
VSRILSQPNNDLLTPWEALPLDPLADVVEELAVEPVDPLAEARELAAQELARARAEAERLRAEAQAQGYAEGAARAEAELQEKREAFEELVSAIEARQETLFTGLEQETIELALEIAKKVVGHEVEAHPELVVAQVRRCLRRLRDRERVRVRVNPADVETLRAAKESLLAAYDGIGRMDIMDDYRVGPGGCLVESSDGTLDARLDRQLSEVERVLREANARAPGA